MKIAIPVEDKSIQSKVCISFGRTPYFLIYDTDTKNSMFLDNSAAASQGGAGIKAAQAITDEGVTALITPRCGENAAAVLTPANITIYKTKNDSIKDNIEAFNNGELNLLSEIHAGFHNHGGLAK
jgi:predicted Fe-Mo cluster-binding NifX family protein